MLPSRKAFIMTCSTKVNDWKVHVKFQESGALLATANGVLLSAPQDAVSFVTDAGKLV